MTESREQMLLVEWCRKTEWLRKQNGLSTFGLDGIFAIPNGGLRTKSEAARLKAEGVTAGVADLLLPVPMVIQPFGYEDVWGGGLVLRDSSEREIAAVMCGLWIEMKKVGEVGKRGGKVGGGRLSDAQLAWGYEMRRRGYAWVACFGAQEAIKAIKGYVGIGDGDLCAVEPVSATEEVMQ